MSDINEEMKRQYKKSIANDYEKLLNEKIKLVNLILNIDFQCYCAKLRTPTIKHIEKMIKEYQNNYKKEK